MGRRLVFLVVALVAIACRAEAKDAALSMGATTNGIFISASQPVSYRLNVFGRVSIGSHVCKSTYPDTSDERGEPLVRCTSRTAVHLGVSADVLPNIYAGFEEVWSRTVSAGGYASMEVDSRGPGIFAGYRKDPYFFEADYEPFIGEQSLALGVGYSF